MTHPVELRGERVVLRPLSFADIEPLARIGNEPGFARWWPGLDEPGLVSMANGAAGSTAFAITVDDRVVGLAQFSEELDPEYRHAGIDVGLGTEWQDRGLGTDAVRTLARYLVHDLGHHRLVIDPAADNHRAVRCYEKAGFRPVGVMRRYERGSDGTFHDGLLMDLLAPELT